MRIGALLQLQWWDVRRNPLIILFAVTTLVMSLIMSLLPGAKSGEIDDVLEVMSMMLTMAVYFIGWNVPSVGLAEEKEKRTLEATLLTPVRPMEILLARAALAGIMTLAAGLVVVLIFRQMPVRPVLLAFAYVVAALFTISLGTLVGLLSPDMKSMNSLGTPVVLVLLFASTLPWKLIAPVAWTVQAWLPTRPLVELLRAGTTGESSYPLVQDALIMVFYIGLVVWACVRLMRRMGVARR